MDRAVTPPVLSRNERIRRASNQTPDRRRIGEEPTKNESLPPELYHGGAELYLRKCYAVQRHPNPLRTENDEGP